MGRALALAAAVAVATAGLGAAGNALAGTPPPGSSAAIEVPVVAGGPAVISADASIWTASRAAGPLDPPQPAAGPAAAPAEAEPAEAAPPAAAPPPPAPPAVAAPAPATPPAARLTLEQRGALALATIRYPWQRLGYEIAFQAGAGTLDGMTNREARRIDVYVTPSESTHRLAFVLAHEIGHAVDFTWMNATTRAMWIGARHFSGDPVWFGCSGCTDFATPAGDFAESFAAWQVGDEGEWASRMGGPPGDGQLAVLAAITIPR